MKRFTTFLNCSLVVMIACGVFAQPESLQAQEPDLKPGTTFRLSFPELPISLFANQTNPKIKTGVSVQLPKNYSRKKKFPLCVYLDGGLGGNGENTALPREFMGKTDYIVASFPLFRKNGYDRESYLNGMIIGFDDYPTISKAYEVILKKLNKTIPNIDPDRSIIGGHSNGAKTVAVVLSAMDETALNSFKGFFLVDGGFTWSSYCRTRELKDHHILFLVGGGRGEKSTGRESVVARMEGLREFAKARKMPNWKFQVVPNHEHEFAEEYHTIIREWARAIKPPKR